MARTLVVFSSVFLAVLGAATLVQQPPTKSSPSEFAFPKYLQCDPRWANDEMGVKGPGERSTICGEGCAMTSTAMALAGLGARAADGELVNPKTLNDWLLANRGYYCAAGDCNNLNLTAPERFDRVMTLIGEKEKPAFAQIVKDIESRAVIHVAHVRNKSHFVLLTWPDPAGTEGFLVHDPFFNTTVYPYANISDIIRFHRDKYPLYKQCNTLWANDVMGQNGDTICQVGCLMTSITMGLAGTGVPINGSTALPPLTNEFLRQHNGYVDGSSGLSEAVIPDIDPSRVQWPADGMHRTNDLNWTTIQAFIDRPVPRIVIANVMHGDHFVLVTGYRSDGDSLVVNDPGFYRITYSYSRDVVGWRIFDMK